VLTLTARAIENWRTNGSPVIPDLFSVSSLLHLEPQYTALRAIYNGLIPGLLLCDNGEHLSKINNTVLQLIKDDKLTDKFVLILMENFVTS
jgi:hypothetical protein